MSVKTYSNTDHAQLSAHFNVQEFKCKCGNTHNILISGELIDKLEQLYTALNCSKIIVTSGYRCPTHDKNVGGTSTGQHTKGTAADICCYGQDGKPISSKLVCCKAQDIGFTGIANIDSSYQYTHVDVRTSGKWYGNEVNGNGTVTSDFYSYYSISKTGDFETSSGILGIDVSEYQGNINWSHVKADGVKFAILRAGISHRVDNQFANNYAGCKSNGVPVGAYWYSKATTVTDAKQEAQDFLAALKGKTFEYPVYMDLEEQSQFALGKEKCSELVDAFLTVLEQAGYFVGLYCSTYYLTNYITDSIRKCYAVWVAQYNDSCTYSGNYGIWQSGVGTIYGIDGDCDIDHGYIDYSTIIKQAGLNGFTSASDSDKSDNNSDTLEQILQHVARIDEKLKYQSEIN